MRLIAGAAHTYPDMIISLQHIQGAAYPIAHPESFVSDAFYLLRLPCRKPYRDET